MAARLPQVPLGRCAALIPSPRRDLGSAGACGYAESKRGAFWGHGHPKKKSSVTEAGGPLLVMNGYNLGNGLTRSTLWDPAPENYDLVTPKMTETFLIATLEKTFHGWAYYVIDDASATGILHGYPRIYFLP